VEQKSIKNNSATNTKSSFNVPNWAPIAVLVFTALIYCKALKNGFAGLDDDLYIVNNPIIKDFSFSSIKTIFSTFYAGFYQPFVLLTYLVEYKLFGLNPLPYHLTNVLLHLINCWLVFKLSEQLSANKLTALIVCALFAIHPMHVESVVWVTERKDVLYTLFYLSSLLAYLNYCKSEFKLQQYSTTLLLFIAALLSKSAAVTLPVVLIAIDMYRGRKITLKSLLEKVPFLLISLLWGIMTIASQKAEGSLFDISLIYSFTQRIFFFTYSIAFYIVKCISPLQLSAMHYYPEYDKALPWQYYVSLPFLLLLGVYMLKKTAFRKELIFGFSFFLIAISVMLQLVPAGRTITAERFSYVSYIGLFYIVGQFISGIDKNELQNKAIGLFLLVLITFSIITWNRIDVWESGETLFTDVLKNYPDNYDAYCIRGLQKSNKGKPQEAIDDYNKAIQLKPTWAEAYNSRGLAHLQLNNATNAITDFSKAIAAEPRKLQSAKSYMNRGLAYEQLGDHQSAALDFDKATLLNPNFSEDVKTIKATIDKNKNVPSVTTKTPTQLIEECSNAILKTPAIAELYDERGRAYYELNNFESALLDYNKAIELKPEWAEAYNSRGLVYFQTHNITSAIKDFSKAISLAPNQSETYMNRGLAYDGIGDIKSALIDFDKAIMLNRNFAEAYTNRYLIKIKTKDLNGALADINKAITLAPNNGENYGYRGIINVMQNNNIGAIADFDRSLQLKPGEARVYYNRGVAHLSVKDTSAACKDWKTAKNLGNEKADVQLKKMGRE
jgi:tetratricopeptide (TPR) repeat protein